MLVVDPTSPVPPYEQVRAQVVAQVRDGDLAPDARLPTVRRLAGDLGLAPGTVARAYRELEAAGVVVTRGRHGTFVATSTDAIVREAGAAARTFAATARRLGISDADAVALVRSSLAETDRAGAEERAAPRAAPSRLPGPAPA